MVPRRRGEAAGKRPRAAGVDPRAQQGAQNPVWDAPGVDVALGPLERFARAAAGAPAGLVSSCGLERYRAAAELFAALADLRVTRCLRPGTKHKPADRRAFYICHSRGSGNPFYGVNQQTLG